MDKDRIEGSAAEIKGKIKEVAGKVLGDAKLESEGKADQAAGKVQNAVGGIKDTLKGKQPQRWGSWRREPHASHCCRHVSALLHAKGLAHGRPNPTNRNSKEGVT
jgi:uncharacterized protein YjbJ (UPF0337 family)